MPEPRKTKDDTLAQRMQEATDFLTKAATATDTADAAKAFDPANPAPGAYTVAMRKGMSFAGSREATLKLLNSVFAPATFTF